MRTRFRTWLFAITLGCSFVARAPLALTQDVNASSTEHAGAETRLAPSDTQNADGVTSQPSGEAASPTGVDRASPPSTEELLRAALDAYERGDLKSARSLFERVHAVAPSARTLRSLGIVAYQEGRYVAAVVLFEQSLVHQVKPLTPELDKGVRELLADASSHIGRVFVRGVPDGSVLELDGAPAIEDAQGALLAAPGTHQLRATASGFLEASAAVEVRAAETVEIVLELEPAVDASVSDEREREDDAPRTLSGAESREKPPPAKRTTPDARRRLRALGYVAAGLAIVSLGTAVGATGTALHRISVIEDACRENSQGTCDPEVIAEQENKANLSTLSRLATATWIGAAVLGASSVTIFVKTGGFSSKSEQKALTVGLAGRF